MQCLYPHVLYLLDSYEIITTDRTHVSLNLCDGCGMPTVDAFSSGHLVSSNLGLAYILIDATSFSQIGFVLRTLIFEHSWLLLFYL